MTAGTLSARRIRRAAPLPNCVRLSALIFRSSAMLCVLLAKHRGASKSVVVARAGDSTCTAGRRARCMGSRTDRVDHGARAPSPRQLRDLNQRAALMANRGLLYG